MVDMTEVIERLARIETKIDTAADHTERIVALEKHNSYQDGITKTMAVLWTGVTTVLGLHLFRNH
jgi:hypothetical protein